MTWSGSLPNQWLRKRKAVGGNGCGIEGPQASSPLIAEHGLCSANSPAVERQLWANRGEIWIWTHRCYAEIVNTDRYENDPCWNIMKNDMILGICFPRICQILWQKNMWKIENIDKIKLINGYKFWSWLIDLWKFIIQGEAKAGLQLWVLKPWSLFLYCYLLTIILVFHTDSCKATFAPHCIISST